MHAQGRTHQLALESTHRFMKSPARDLFGNGGAAKFLRQIFHAQVIVAIGQHQAALDDVLQLPHVARPAMPRQGAEKSWSKAPHLFVVCLGKYLQEIFGKEWNILGSLAYRWHMDSHHGGPEMQVLADGP